MDELLIAKLAEIQDREGLNGVEFASRLGVHTSYWHLVKNGDRGIGRKLLDGALAAFPEFAIYYAEALKMRQAIVDDQKETAAA